MALEPTFMQMEQNTSEIGKTIRKNCHGSETWPNNAVYEGNYFEEKKRATILRAKCTDCCAEISVLEPFCEKNALEQKRYATRLRAGCIDSRAEISVLEPFRARNVSTMSLFPMILIFFVFS